MKNLKTIATLVTLLSATALGSPAIAGDEAAGLNDWAEAAAVAVDKKMSYPAMAVRNGDSGSTRQLVTIDRYGNVIDAELTERARAGTINSASKRLAKQADFPALPTSFDGDRLTFALELNYHMASSTHEEIRLRRQGNVESYRLSGGAKGNQRFASIEIISGAAE